MSMDEFANHIIYVVHNSGRMITNLQLQKIMYFTMQFAVKKGKLTETQLQTIYNEPFLVWRYGPVVKSVYNKYKIYGSDPITEDGNENPDWDVLNKEIIRLSNKNVFDLVDQSHAEHYWKMHEKDIQGWRSNIKYTLKDIANE